MRDLRTLTYLFRLSVKAFGLFVTYVTMCLNLFWIRLKLTFITCSQIILDFRQLIRLKNLETRFRTGILHHSTFSPVKSKIISKISPLVNRLRSYDYPQKSFQDQGTGTQSLDSDRLEFILAEPTKKLKILSSVHARLVNQVIMFRLGLLLQNDKIIIHN